MVLRSGEILNIPNPVKILIIRFSSIGDIVLTTPVVRCVKEQISNVELHYLTKPQFGDILKANPHIDKIHYLKKSLWDTITELRKEGFNYLIDLHNNQRTLAVKAGLLKRGHSFNKLNFEKWLMVHFKINRLTPVHLVDRYFGAVNRLGVTNDGKGLDYFIPPEDEISLQSLPATHQNGYTGFVIGAVHFTKKFPVHKVIKVCQLLNQPVVLLGGKAEEQAGETIASKAGNLVYNACGKYSINQSASLVKQADKVITNDTGLMHIAAAFQKPVVSLWGNTIPEFGMYPYNGQDQKDKMEIVEVTGLDCRPCSKLGHAQCPQKHFKCMETIDEKKVAELVGTV